VQCSRCPGNFSPRHGTIFSAFHLDLVTLGRLLCYFDACLLIHQTAQLTTITRQTLSRFYERVRQRCSDYTDAHPVLFDFTDIVEIDEVYLGPLRRTADDGGRVCALPLSV
jgi:hypothetical protein